VTFSAAPTERRRDELPSWPGLRPDTPSWRRATPVS